MSDSIDEDLDAFADAAEAWTAARAEVKRVAAIEPGDDWGADWRLRRMDGVRRDEAEARAAFSAALVRLLRAVRP